MLTAVVTGVLVAGTPTADAQTSLRPFRGYVEGVILADLDPATYAEGSHTSPATAFAAGITFPTPWTVRFEGVLPAWHTNAVDDRFSFAGRTMTTTGTQRHRLSTYSFLTGYEFSMAPRIRLTPLVGVGFTRHADKVDVVSQTQLASGAVTRTPEVTDDVETLTTISYGADFSIAVTQRIGIVPQIRFDTITEHLGAPRFRPGLGLRVGF